MITMRDWFLVLICLGMAIPAWAETVEVTYCFGKVEVLRQGKSEWEFLKKGTQLDSEDRLRTPPVSSLRLKTSKEGMLPMFTGVREALVAQILDEGYAKLQRLRSHHTSVLAQDEAAIDVLPTGDPLEVQSTSESHSVFALSPEIVGTVEAEMDRVPEEIQQMAREWRAEHSVSPYASESVQIASSFYDHLVRDREEFAMLDLLLTYGRLLVASGIEVELRQSKQNEPLLMVNTSLRPEESKTLTINQGLAPAEDGKIWLPLHFGHPSPTFVAAWYDGAREIQAQHVDE